MKTHELKVSFQPSGPSGVFQGVDARGGIQNLLQKGFHNAIRLHLLESQDRTL